MNAFTKFLILTALSSSIHAASVCGKVSWDFERGALLKARDGKTYIVDSYSSNRLTGSLRGSIVTLLEDNTNYCFLDAKKYYNPRSIRFWSAAIIEH